MPTVYDEQKTPLTFEVGGVSFTVRDFENELTTAENRLLMKAIAPLMGYAAPSGKSEIEAAKTGILMMSDVDIALVLAICTRPTKGVFDKNRVMEWREFFDDNPTPKEAQDVYQLFLSIAPASIAKFSPIFTPKTKAETSEKKPENSGKRTKS
jgi:hypothetical protein